MERIPSKMVVGYPSLMTLFNLLFDPYELMVLVFSLVNE